LIVSCSLPIPVSIYANDKEIADRQKKKKEEEEEEGGGEDLEEDEEEDDEEDEKQACEDENKGMNEEDEDNEDNNEDNDEEDDEEEDEEDDEEDENASKLSGKSSSSSSESKKGKSSVNEKATAASKEMVGINKEKKEKTKQGNKRPDSGNKGGYQYLKPKKPVEFSLSGFDWRARSNHVKQAETERRVPFLHQMIPFSERIFSSLSPFDRYQLEEDFILSILSIWDTIWWRVKRQSESRFDAFVRMLSQDRNVRLFMRDERLIEREERKVMKKEERRMRRLLAFEEAKQARIEQRRKLKEEEEEEKQQVQKEQANDANAMIEDEEVAAFENESSLMENGEQKLAMKEEEEEENDEVVWFSSDGDSDDEEEEDDDDEDYEDDDLDFEEEELRASVVGYSPEMRRGIVGEEELCRFLDEVYYCDIKPGSEQMMEVPSDPSMRRAQYCESMRISLLLTYPSGLRRVIRRLEQKGQLQVLHRDTGELLLQPLIRFCHPIQTLLKKKVHA
jgi:hypothetical protein